MSAWPGSYVHPVPLLAGAMGNMQFLPDGRVFVGWGTEPYFSEFGDDGTLLVDGRAAHRLRVLPGLVTTGAVSPRSPRTPPRSPTRPGA